MSKTPKLTAEDRRQLKEYIKEQERAQQSVWGRVWQGLKSLAFRLTLKIVEEAIINLLEHHGMETTYLKGKWEEFKRWVSGTSKHWPF